MPYKSYKQRRFFHSPGAAKTGIGKATVKEFDKASKGKELPKEVRHKSTNNKWKAHK